MYTLQPAVNRSRPKPFPSVNFEIQSCRVERSIASIKPPQPLHAATHRRSHLGEWYVTSTPKVRRCGQERPSLCFERLSKQLNKESTTNKIHSPRIEFAKSFLPSTLADSAAVERVDLSALGLMSSFSGLLGERLPHRITRVCMPSQAQCISRTSPYNTEIIVSRK